MVIDEGRRTMAHRIGMVTSGRRRNVIVEDAEGLISLLPFCQRDRRHTDSLAFGSFVL